MFQTSTFLTATSTVANVVAITGLLTLQGCSQEIDVRQVHVEQGLMYKKDATDPFTGTVINVDIAKITKKYISLLPSLDGSCTAQLKNGLFDGEAICKSPTGKKIVEIMYNQGHQNGAFKAWGVDNDNLIVSTTLREGYYDGLMERYNPKTGKTISRVNYLAGEKSGEEKLWDITGENLLTDLTWENGTQTGVSRDGGIEAHYKAGSLNGSWKRCQWASSLTPEKRQAYIAKEYTYSGFAQQLGGTYFLSAIADSSNDIECTEEIYIDGTKQIPIINAESGISTNACLESKIEEFHKKMGNDIPISNDMTEEWKSMCGQ